jgi:hypothetical protein
MQFDVVQNSYPNSLKKLVNKQKIHKTYLKRTKRKTWCLPDRGIHLSLNKWATRNADFSELVQRRGPFTWCLLPEEFICLSTINPKP